MTVTRERASATNLWISSSGCAGKGLEEFYGMVLSENKRMLHLCEKLASPRFSSRRCDSRKLDAEVVFLHKGDLPFCFASFHDVAVSDAPAPASAEAASRRQARAGLPGHVDMIIGSASLPAFLPTSRKARHPADLPVIWDKLMISSRFAIDRDVRIC